MPVATKNKSTDPEDGVMVILMNDLPRQISARDVKELVEHYHPVRRVDTLAEREKRVDWKVDLGETDREIANFITDRLHGKYWKGCYINAYCPLYQ